MKAVVDRLGPMIYVHEILYMKSRVNHFWLVVCVYIRFCDAMGLCLTKKEERRQKRGELRSCMTDDD